MLSEALDAVFPSWLVRLDTAPTSRDPLGLAAQAGRHADQILPGLNVFTTRARYYSFLAWAVRTSEPGPRGGHLDRLHRLERLLVLSEALRHAEDPDECTYVGRRRGKSYVHEHARDDLWELPSRILKNQVTNGAFRLYRTSLASLGIVEEADDDSAALGLVLTARGHALASQYEKCVDDNVVRWALAEPEQRKRRGTLLDCAAGMCLSARIGAYERRQLVTALVGKEEQAFIRRETVRVLFQHRLLASHAPLVDVAAEDADAIADDGGKPAEEAAAAETRGNWGVIRGVLELGPRPELRDLHVAASYEVVALALNRFFSACIDAVLVTGRMGIGAWGERVGARAGEGYADRPAKEWMGNDSVVSLAERVLASSGEWDESASLAMRLLLRAIHDDRIRSSLTDQRVDIVARALDMATEASSKSAAHLARQLVSDCVDHHMKVSMTKGKTEWVLIDEGDLVRREPQETMPLFHALRFVQLAQLARDLKLSTEDVADET